MFTIPQDVALGAAPPASPKDPSRAGGLRVLDSNTPVAHARTPGKDGGGTLSKAAAMVAGLPKLVFGDGASENARADEPAPAPSPPAEQREPSPARGGAADVAAEEEAVAYATETEGTDAETEADECEVDASDVERREAAVVGELMATIRALEEDRGYMSEKMQSLMAELINAQEDAAMYQEQFEKIRADGASLYTSYQTKCESLKRVQSELDRAKADAAKQEAAPAEAAPAEAPAAAPPAEAGRVRAVHSDAEWDSILASNNVVVCCFSATWCGPCKALAPHLAELARDNPQVCVVKVDVDEMDRLAERCSITAMPTLQTFRGSLRVDTTQGGNPLAASAHVQRAVSGGKRKQPRFDTSLQHRMQQWAVVVVLSEGEQVPCERQQPVFNVLGMFETAEIAEGYIRNVAGNHNKDYDMHIVAMYEWVNPLDAHKNKHVNYRDPEMQRIMDATRSEANRVDLLRSLDAAEPIAEER